MINKFQTGGNIEMQLAQELVQLGLPEESVQQLAQNKDIWGQLVQIYQQEGIQGVQTALQQLVQQQQQQTQAMRHGAKLNYIKQISGICPEGTQLTYFKAGGRICSKCEAMAKKKQGGGTMDDIRAQLVEKCGGKMKKNNGGKMKNGNKICPKCGKIHSGKCGSKMKKHQLGGIITAMQKFKNGGSLNGVPFTQENEKNKIIPKGQTGLVINDPTYRTQEEVDKINAGNRNLARGLFRDLTSGNIAPSIQNIGRMVSAGYRGYLEPERVNKPLTGLPPAVSPSSSLFVKPSTINYVANPAEKAARADFLKDATNKFEKTIAGSGKISKGVVDDWNYPRRILNKFRPATSIETPTASGPGLNTIPSVETPVVVTPTASSPGLNTIPKPAISSTSKLQDRKAGISGINRDKYRRAAAMETEDARHVNSGFRRVIRGQFDLAKDAIRNYPQYYDPYRRVRIKLDTVSDPKRLSELKKQERNILREFITKIGL